MPESTWRLEGHLIKAIVYPKDSSVPRESVLDLDLCCRMTSSWTENYLLSYIRAPDDLSHPDNEQLPSMKLSEEPDLTITDAGNGKLHSRKTLKRGLSFLPPQVFESVFDLNSCLRYTDDGRVEFKHLPNENKMPDWAKALFKALEGYEKKAQLVGGLGPVGDKLERLANELVDHFQEWVLPRVRDPDVKEWLQGTYVDAEGKLIRRGT